MKDVDILYASLMGRVKSIFGIAIFRGGLLSTFGRAKLLGGWRHQMEWGFKHNFTQKSRIYYLPKTVIYPRSTANFRLVFSRHTCSALCPPEFCDVGVATRRSLLQEDILLAVLLLAALTILSQLELTHQEAVRMVDFGNLCVCPNLILGSKTLHIYIRAGLSRGFYLHP